MRQRSAVQRLFTALFGIWFSLLVAEPPALRPCPMHDGPPAMTAAHHDAMAGSAADVARDHAAMHHASFVHQPPTRDREHDRGAHQCQCLGCCAGTSALSLPTFPPPVVLATVIATKVRRIEAAAALRATTRFAHALPFANGPPDLARLAC